jgi:hypothetical protein
MSSRPQFFCFWLPEDLAELECPLEWDGELAAEGCPEDEEGLLEGALPAEVRIMALMAGLI